MSSATVFSPRKSKRRAVTSNDGVCAACERQVEPRPVIHTDSIQLYHCNYCGTLTSLPRPTPKSQASLHDTAEYFDHPYFQARREDDALALKRCERILDQIAGVTDLALLRGEPMLDIGCDSGSLLVAAAQKCGVSPLGVDVSERAAQIARSRGLNVFRGMLEQAPPEFTGVKLVTAVDVLEHVVDPGSLLEAISSRLRTGGIAFIQTPNRDSVVYNVGRILSRLTQVPLQNTLERLFPPQHIQYFSRRGLEILAERIGFQVLHIRTRILPMPDIVTSGMVRFGLMGLQGLDFVLGREILLCAVLCKS